MKFEIPNLFKTKREKRSLVWANNLICLPTFELKEKGAGFTVVILLLLP
jgi:hypothetical protein